MKKCASGLNHNIMGSILLAQLNFVLPNLRFLLLFFRFSISTLAMERLPILPLKNAPSSSSSAAKNGIVDKVEGGILARALGKLQNQSKWSDEEDDDGEKPTAVVVLPSVLQQVFN